MNRVLPDSPSSPRRPSGRRSLAGRRARFGLLLALGAIAMSMPVNATDGCSDLPYVIEASKLTLGPRHHPLGRPLPTSPGFNQPDQCDGVIRFFDQNHSGKADPGEIRLFGPLRQVDCQSCHGEVPDFASARSSSLFLRQDASTLCLVCHKL